MAVELQSVCEKRHTQLVKNLGFLSLLYREVFICSNAHMYIKLIRYEGR